MMDDVVRRISRQQSSSDDVVDQEIPPKPPEMKALSKKKSPETPINSKPKPKFSNIARQVGRAKLAMNNLTKKTRPPSPKPVFLP